MRHKNLFGILQDARFLLADGNFFADKIVDAHYRGIFRDDDLTSLGVKSRNSRITGTFADSRENSQTVDGVRERVTLNNRQVKKFFVEQSQIRGGTCGCLHVKRARLAVRRNHFGKFRAVSVIHAARAARAETQIFVRRVGAATETQRDYRQEQQEF